MPSSFFKSFTALIAIILGCLLLTLSVAVIWLHEVVIDSNRYVDTVTPLAKDAAVKDAVADYATEDLFRHVDVEQLARATLPGNSELVVGPMVGGLKGYVYRQIREQLDTPEFVSVWKVSNREAHDSLLKMMRGDGAAVTGNEAKVLIDISRVFDMVKARLSAAGLTFLDDVQIEAGHQFAIFQLPALAKAQWVFNLLERAALWLPVLGIGLLTAGVWLSAHRGRALAGAGLGLALFTLLLYLGLGSLRTYYLDAITSRGTIDVPAAASFYDVMVSPLRALVEFVGGGGLILAVGAFVASLLSAGSFSRRA